MISWAQAHTRAATLAGQLHADLSVDLTRPVDVYDAISQLDLVLAFADLGPASGIYLPGGRSTGILLHAGHPVTRQRYTAGHELGHHAFGHALDVDIDLEGALRRGDSDRWPDHEKEAEAFGAWFLMPRRLMRVALRELSITTVTSPLQVYMLSLWLGTSYTATARHLGTTRLVSDGEATAWARIKPREVKRELAGRFVPNDMRNDVWSLRKEDSGRRLEARSGDRVVVELAEVPSSGHSWRIRNATGAKVVADSFVDEFDVSPSTGWLLEEAAGATVRHAFVLEIESSDSGTTVDVELVKDQPWDPGPVAEEFRVGVRVRPSLHGIQLPEHEFRIAS